MFLRRLYYFIFLYKLLILTLQHRFNNLIGNYTNNQSLIDKLWSELFTHYNEKYRAYHNLAHLEELFNYYDVYNNSLLMPEIVAFSIFYHDIVYNIWKKDNEEKSADFALTVLKEINLPNHYYADIKNQILATKTHSAYSEDAQFLIDFDLAILGQSLDIYINYTQKIRKEYKLVPDVLYRNGRKKVLQHFLKKETIYATSIFKELYEKQARNNLMYELTIL